MKKTIFALLALATIANAAEVTWTNATGDGNWATQGNWSTGAVPVSGDTIIIDGANATYTATSNGVKYDKSTKWVVKNGSVVTLGTRGVSTTAGYCPRFDGAFDIDATSSVTSSSFLVGTSNIYGTLYVNNAFGPNEGGATINFGEAGKIQFLEGAMNGIEGNDRTLTIGAVLDTGIKAADAVYSVETRYLICGPSGQNFNFAQWNGLTIANGTMTGTNGLTLTSAREGNIEINTWVPTPTDEDPNAGHRNSFRYTTDSLVASAENFGQYLIGCDGAGLYVQYVKSSVSIPEPATATLSLLALAGLAARRRRK